MWESFTPEEWENLPFISGRVATEEDVENGNAVFYIPYGSVACDAALPTCVIQIDEETYERTPAVVIQAEQAGELVYLGLRYLDGGNGMCELDEVELLESPNEEFTT
ncbi:hypothetical protein EKG38_15555 [Shewanella canadensis]|uniref:Uncharacterized protein n=1 Tax=Shewanella canadensis TaxID=271096 RepID=A0A3S0KTD4_9GAMM|nr:hypothetical protein [Shewanella canadensis]RTR37980.1 hypothetical protein EKG38_15555 [Shewanella canadensis]